MNNCPICEMVCGKCECSGDDYREKIDCLNNRIRQLIDSAHIHREESIRLEYKLNRIAEMRRLKLGILESG